MKQIINFLLSLCAWIFIAPAFLTVCICHLFEFLFCQKTTPVTKWLDIMEYDDRMGLFKIYSFICWSMIIICYLTYYKSASSI